MQAAQVAPEQRMDLNHPIAACWAGYLGHDGTTQPRTQARTGAS